MNYSTKIEFYLVVKMYLFSMKYRSVETIDLRSLRYEKDINPN